MIHWPSSPSPLTKPPWSEPLLPMGSKCSWALIMKLGKTFPEANTTGIDSSLPCTRHELKLRFIGEWLTPSPRKVFCAWVVPYWHAGIKQHKLMFCSLVCVGHELAVHRGVQGDREKAKSASSWWKTRSRAGKAEEGCRFNSKPCWSIRLWNPLDVGRDEPFDQLMHRCLCHAIAHHTRGPTQARL